jgi:cytidine deaminase
MTDRELVQIALETKDKAYAPYSGFKVGAALLTDTGKVYTGVNIENLSYGATNCAERTAVFKAVADGEKNITAIAITSDSNEFTFPCGICRQVIMEFATGDTKVIGGNNKGEYKVTTMREQLPYAFNDEAFRSRG